MASAVERGRLGDEQRPLHAVQRDVLFHRLREAPVHHPLVGEGDTARRVVRQQLVHRLADRYCPGRTKLPLARGVQVHVPSRPVLHEDGVRGALRDGLDQLGPEPRLGGGRRMPLGHAAVLPRMCDGQSDEQHQQQRQRERRAGEVAIHARLRGGGDALDARRQRHHAAAEAVECARDREIVGQRRRPVHQPTDLAAQRGDLVSHIVGVREVDQGGLGPIEVAEREPQIGPRPRWSGPVRLMLGRRQGQKGIRDMAARLRHAVERGGHLMNDLVELTMLPQPERRHGHGNDGHGPHEGPAPGESQPSGETQAGVKRRHRPRKITQARGRFLVGRAAPSSGRPQLRRRGRCLQERCRTV